MNAVNNFHLLNKEFNEKLELEFQELVIEKEITIFPPNLVLPFIKQKCAQARIDTLKKLNGVANLRSGGDINARVISAGDLIESIKVQNGYAEILMTEGEEAANKHLEKTKTKQQIVDEFLSNPSPELVERVEKEMDEAVLKALIDQSIKEGAKEVDGYFKEGE